MNVVERALALVVLVAGSQCLAGDAVQSLKDGWKFKTGDDAAWAQPEHDDSSWQSIAVGSDWESQGAPDYNGYAWYRLQLEVPADVSLPQGKLRLELGAIDDVDETWFNGERIGATGTFPPDYGPSWSVPRSYLVPARLLKPGADNVIAVRVYDGDGRGGMVDGPYTLAPATLGDLLSVRFDLGRGDGVFIDEPALPIRATVKNESQHDCVCQAVWTIEDDEGQPLATQDDRLELTGGKANEITCDFAPDTPGFYRVQLQLIDEKGQEIKATSMFLGYRPEKIDAPLTAQQDLEEFWQQTRQALTAVSPEFELIAKPDDDTETHQLFEVRMRSLGDVRVGGWYQQPKAPGQHPAVLRVPGYTENMRPIEIEEPVAVFSFNVRGHGNSQKDVSGEPVDYWVRGLDDKQGYFYQGAYADCLRAVDFLASRPEIDQARLAVTGGSQGGGLSLATAALDERIDLCAPDIPFLCDWVKYFKTTHWPEMDKWIAADDQRTWETTLRTMGYFDALNLADRITCPVFLGMGLQDDVCPPATIFSVYNRLNVPKQYYVYPHAAHWVDAEHTKRQWAWLEEQFEALKRD